MMVISSVAAYDRIILDSLRKIKWNVSEDKESLDEETFSDIAHNTTMSHLFRDGRIYFGVYADVS
jgi:hypothetical protein